MGREERRKAERQARQDAIDISRSVYGQTIIRRAKAEKEARARIERNGITTKDLEKNYEIGYKQARKECAEYALKMGWSSIFMALHEEFGFGTERLKKVLFKTVEIGQRYLTADEAVKALDEATGFKLTEYNDVL